MSPATAALSLEARRRTAPPPDDVERRARFFFLGLGVVLGCVYLFPGLHKALAPTSPFLDGDALARLLRLKAFEASAAVPFGLDGYPRLLVGFGVLVVLVEVMIFPLAVVPKTRPVAALVIVSLHAGLAAVVFIPFTALAVFSIALALSPRSAVPTLLPDLVAAPRAQRAVTALVVLGVATAGAAGEMRAFPFAAYPTFSSRVPQQLSTLELRVVDQRVAEVIPRARWAPPEVRTATLAAARRVKTPDAAAAFGRRRAWAIDLCSTSSAWRARADARLEVWRVEVDLREPALPQRRRHLLFADPLTSLCGTAPPDLGRRRSARDI